MSKRGLLVLLSLVMAATLTACSPAEQGAVTLDRRTGLPALVLELCEKEGVSGVRLYEAHPSENVYDLGRLIWRIDATQLSRRGRFVIGETPEGFVERQTIRLPLPAAMVLTAKTRGGTGVGAGGYFETEQLKPGVLLSGGTAVSQAELRRAAEGNCTSSLFAGWNISGRVVAGILGVLALSLGISLYFVRRSYLSRRTSDPAL